MKALVLVVSLLTAGMAFASPKQLNMPKGHTTTVAMPAPVAKIVVADPSMLDAHSDGRKVVFVGRATGSTDVTVTTSDGELHFRVYVAADKYGLPY